MRQSVRKQVIQLESSVHALSDSPRCSPPLTASRAPAAELWAGRPPQAQASSGQAGHLRHQPPAGRQATSSTSLQRAGRPLQAPASSGQAGHLKHQPPAGRQATSSTSLQRGGRPPQAPASSGEAGHLKHQPTAGTRQATSSTSLQRAGRVLARVVLVSVMHASLAAAGGCTAGCGWEGLMSWQPDGPQQQPSTRRALGAAHMLPSSALQHLPRRPLPPWYATKLPDWAPVCCSHVPLRLRAQ
jgi:hypothetical protein